MTRSAHCSHEGRQMMKRTVCTMKEGVKDCRMEHCDTTQATTNIAIRSTAASQLCPIILVRRARRTGAATRRRSSLVASVLVFVLSFIYTPPNCRHCLLCVQAANYYDDAYVAANDDQNAAAAGDDAAAAAADDAAAAADDAAAADATDDYTATDDTYSSRSSSSGYENEQKQYQNTDDDTFHWNSNIGFDGVSLMPLSCINYNSGHMIKFQLFDSANSYQCHFAEISTFVVSISHYMRAYFNYEALKEGQDFTLPSDAAYLDCTPLQISGAHLYAKIGCMERETFTSTKLQLHVYTDQQCSQQYKDGQSARKHTSRGYDYGGYLIPSKVSFKPEFYSCLTCSPEQISQTFNKINSNWYDDDHINANSNQYAKSDDGGRNLVEIDEAPAVYQSKQIASASPERLQAYHDAFWTEVEDIRRNLYDNNYYDVGDWNMCQRIYKYGIWCDAECRSLDFFRTDLWSASDIFLLAIMCTFLTAMMLLVIAKRLKAQQKARMYGEDQLPMPGLPPFAMAIMYFVIMIVIAVLAKLKFINETLVFAVVTCILLFIYMLKLTLFENRRPVLLAAPRHDMFDNPLDDHLFE